MLIGFDSYSFMYVNYDVIISHCFVLFFFFFFFSKFQNPSLKGDQLLALFVGFLFVFLVLGDSMLGMIPFCCF